MKTMFGLLVPSSFQFNRDLDNMRLYISLISSVTSSSRSPASTLLCTNTRWGKYSLTCNVISNVIGRKEMSCPMVGQCDHSSVADSFRWITDTDPFRGITDTDPFHEADLPKWNGSSLQTGFKYYRYSFKKKLLGPTRLEEISHWNQNQND